MNTLTRFNPARDILTIRNLMERVFDETLAPANYSAQVEQRLAVDAYATSNEIVVQAALPGVKPEDVEITVENDMLKLSAELPKRLDTADYAFAERPHGRFSRTLMLNVAVQADKAEAHFEHGLLTLTLPKAETVKPKTIKVKAK